MFNKKKQLEALKRHAQNLRRLRSGQQLAPWPQADELLYAINPVFAEISQGGASPMRGWGSLIFALGAFVAAYGLYVHWIMFEAMVSTEEVTVGGVAMLAIGAALLILVAAIPVLWLYFSFFAVTDVIVRFDRKRSKVWMWTGGGPIEMHWAKLEPAVIGMAASAQMPGRTYRGIYAEFDERGEFKTTRNIPHVIQVGQISGAEEGVMPALEYVRLFMERGPQALPVPNRLLRHRPRWYAMVNFLGMADEWALIAEGKPAPLGKPWFRTAVFVLFFPLLFPLQFTNWLALRVAPVPKWPRDISEMHEADLRALASEPSQEASKAARPRRQPVIRVNGEVVAGKPADER